MAVAGSTANLLEEAEGRELLRMARESLRELLFSDAEDRPPGPPRAVSGRLATEARGVFVTLTRGGRLRGCTGYVEGVKPLAEAVRDLAISSATRDFRFPAVEPDELESLHIEVSVLTRPYPIDPSQVEIGRHGLIARMGGRSGLLLPQVAPEWGWDVPQFLEHTCEKAGLPRDSWKTPGCELLAFEAQIFDE